MQRFLEWNQKRNANRIHFWYMNKDDAINIMNGSDLAGKGGVL